MVEVEILTTVVTAQYGTLTTGTILRCGEDFAKHLVKDACAAKYVEAEEKNIVEEEKIVEKETLLKKKKK